MQEEDGQVFTEEVTTNKEDKTVFQKHQNFIVGEDDLVGTVTIVVGHHPICAHGNATVLS